MEINRLKLFATIVETGNLRRSAELHSMSPGALSKSMKCLSDELAITLFLPSGRGIAITDQGREIYKLTQPLIRDLEYVVKTVKTGNTGQRPIRIGSFEVFTTYLLGEIAQHHLPEYPITLHELTPGKIESATINREVDFGITYVPMPQPELDFLKVTSFEMGLFAKKKQFTDCPFIEIPFAIPTTSTSGSPADIQGLDGWPYNKVPRNVKYRFEMLESALETTRRGLSAIYCPKFIIRLQNQMLKEDFQLQALSLPDGVKPTNMSIYLVKRKSDTEDPQLKKIAKAIRLVCTEK